MHRFVTETTIERWTVLRGDWIWDRQSCGKRDADDGDWKKVKEKRAKDSYISRESCDKCGSSE